MRISEGTTCISQGRLLTCRKSFREQQPQFLADSIPIISIDFMFEGVPRAPKEAAGASVLDFPVSYYRRPGITSDRSLVLQDLRQFRVIALPIRSLKSEHNRSG